MKNTLTQSTKQKTSTKQLASIINTSEGAAVLNLPNDILPGDKLPNERLF